MANRQKGHDSSAREGAASDGAPATAGSQAADARHCELGECHVVLLGSSMGSPLIVDDAKQIAIVCSDSVGVLEAVSEWTIGVR
jgi:hypothetical protein